MIRVYLPSIGDGTGGTVVPGSYQLISAPENDVEVLCNLGKRKAVVKRGTRRLFIAGSWEQNWSSSDHPNTFPAADVTDLPAGGGGPHATTHQNAGSDEINIAALSGLLADPQAPLSHTHIVADTTGLQTALDGKAASVHSHAIADVTSLQTTLDGKAAASHTHAIADTTGLQSALDGKAAASHTHAQSDVTGLVAALADKSAVGHTHPASEIVSGVLAAARIATGTPDGTKFLRDDQVWSAPGGGGADPWTYRKVTGSDFTTSSATAVDVTGLNFTPVASTDYEFEGLVLLRTATTTVNPRLGLAWPTGGIDGVAMIEEAQTATAIPLAANGNINAALLIAVGGLPNTTQSWPARVQGIFRAGASPSGNVRLQLASETAGTTVRVVIGSFLRFRTIP